MLRPKRVQDSRTEQIQILMPEHINGAGRLFGGKLVEWIDVVAGVVARRHSGRNVITAAIGVNRSTALVALYLVLVALDEQEQPVEVPGLLLENETERAEWEAGERRRELRSRRRKEGY